MRSKGFNCSIRRGSSLISSNLSHSTDQSTQLPLFSLCCLFLASLQLSIIFLSSHPIPTSCFCILQIDAHQNFLQFCAFLFGYNLCPLRSASLCAKYSQFHLDGIP